ncbi:hypothetical protein [Streptomyces mirabilis]|uniref:hypothetical protein n=1 Tax=Streptomyces mirabilis TaxID=68239 RepID=UPI0033C7C947
MSQTLSTFQAHVEDAVRHLTRAGLTVDSPSERHLAAAQVHALLALASAIASTSQTHADAAH